jgi:hypothetical protein
MLYEVSKVKCKVDESHLRSFSERTDTTTIELKATKDIWNKSCKVVFESLGHKSASSHNLYDIHDYSTTALLIRSVHAFCEKQLAESVAVSGKPRISKQINAFIQYSIVYVCNQFPKKRLS